MGYSVSVSIHVKCDRCPYHDFYEFSESTSDSEIEDFLESEGWSWKDGDLVCSNCACDTEDRYERDFLDRCRECTRHMNRGVGHIHCPHWKRDCSKVFDQLYGSSASDVAPECPHYLPKGGVKEGPPQYKPTTASLEGFVEGLGKEDP